MDVVVNAVEEELCMPEMGIAARTVQEANDLIYIFLESSSYCGRQRHGM